MGRWTWILGGLLLAGLAVLGLTTLGDGRKLEPLERGPLVFAEDTTRILGPRTEDGRPDYLAVLNDVTPPPAEENAAIPLLRVLGTNALVGGVEATLRRIGAPDDLPEESGFVPAADEVQAELWSLDEAVDPANEGADEEDWAPSDALRAWFATNQEVLDQLVEATRRPALWWPVVFDPGAGLIGMALPAQALQDPIEALSMRAALAVVDGDAARAWPDTAALVRLSVLIEDQAGSMGRLLSATYQQQAVARVRYLLEKRAPDAARVREMLSVLRAVPAPRPYLGDVDVFDRYMMLDGFLRQPGVVQAGAGVHPALRAINVRYDEVAMLLREPDGGSFEALEQDAAETKARIKALSDEIGTPLGKVKQAAEAIATGGASAVRLSGEVLAHMGTAVVPMTFRHVYRMETRRHAAIVATALRIHALEHGSFPASLDALVPDVLEALPVGSLDGSAVPYRVTDEGCVVGSEDEDEGWAITLTK
ncbi:MAG: hypothetical protein QNJ98_12280 [Planctomycetota bacterium]|nr:hypothetical protein [Planctomycetota bacterium]